MLYPITGTSIDGDATGPAPVHASLPGTLVVVEQLTGALRRFLAGRGLGDWPIFFCSDGDLSDIDRLQCDLGEATAQWEAPAPQIDGGEQPGARWKGDKGHYFIAPPGFLHLPSSRVVVARWFQLNERNTAWTSVYLYAAESSTHFGNLRVRASALRRKQASSVWQIISGQYRADDRLPRDGTLGWDDLVLAVAARDRLQAEVIGFFSEPVAKMYRELGVPYRRGMLLHGPPGNGKTSIIRVIGAMRPDLPILIIRPGNDFDHDDFQSAIDNWCEQAPAILVIEDLDWLLPKISVSTFLNLIDGIDRRDDGLMMIATTNHPESLDPALNNRPGRFDVVLEIPNPSADLRLAYLKRVLKFDEPFLADLAKQTEGLSFAHLRELNQLSGLTALREGRTERNKEDVLFAANLLTETSSAARHGFPETNEPFGLARWHVEKRR